MFGFYDTYLKFFGLTITYYGLIIACAMGIGVALACKNAKMRGLKSNDILLVACYIIPLAIIGARLYYVIFDSRSYSFVDVLRIWDGGLAVYGGVIGGALGIALYCAIHRKNFLDVADVAVPSLLLGQAIGRIGCYFAGCCYGIETTDPNLQYFPLSVMIDGRWHLATMFYESLWNLIGFGVLIFMLRYFRVKQRGSIAGSYFVIYGVGRAMIETLRGDSLYIGSLKVSQVLSIILIGVGLALIIFYLVKNKLEQKKVAKKIEEHSRKIKMSQTVIKHNNLFKNGQKIKKNIQKTLFFAKTRQK